MEIRRVTLIAFAALLAASGARASIRTYPLDERAVYSIRISPGAPTTCVFPGAPIALEGAHVAAKPEDNPPVLLSYQPGAEYFTVRALHPDAAGALNVVFRGRVVALSFVTASEADRVVTFFDPPLARAGEPSGHATPEALEALIERAKTIPRIIAQYPAMSFTLARAQPGTVTTYRDFAVSVEEVFRFDREDALVLRLRFENSSDGVIHYSPEQLSVRVGKDVFPAARTEATGAIPAHAETRAFVVIAGAPHGGCAHLSVNETFTVIVPRR